MGQEHAWSATREIVVDSKLGIAIERNGKHGCRFSGFRRDTSLYLGQTCKKDSKLHRG